jgi:hypothetical protein
MLKKILDLKECWNISIYHEVWFSYKELELQNNHLQYMMLLLNDTTNLEGGTLG